MNCNRYNIMFDSLNVFSEERSYVARKSEPIIIESVEYEYIGTDKQFKVFLRSIIKDYLSEDKLQPDKIIMEKSA